MSKRRAEDVITSSSSTKRLKTSRIDHLSALSDEILLRVFSNLSTYELTLCQRVSHRFYTVGGDTQLWKAAYYDRFVRPRVSRIPKTHRAKDASLPTPSKLSRWLADDYPVKRGAATNWKRQYKLRHKWSNGTCKIRDIPLPSSPVLPVLARLHDGIVYTVDSSEGLRAWSYKDDQQLLASKPLRSDPDNQVLAQPTSLALDSSGCSQSCSRLVIGFNDGSFSIYCYEKQDQSFRHLYSHASSSNRRLYGVAISWPFLLSISATQTLSLYKFREPLANQGDSIRLNDPRLVTSLKSHTAWTPLSLSLRPRSTSIIAAIAYCTPTCISGWSTGVQEVHLAHDGDILDSRSASAYHHSPVIYDSYRNSNPSTPPASNKSKNAANLDQASSKPTSLSYSHPYLLAGHSDNTLTLYMVTSTNDTLSISSGRRLWGHTSSVFDAHVGSRGKAVSVSSRGDEIRIWELERSNLSGNCRTEAASDVLSVQVTPESKRTLTSRLSMDPETLVARDNVEVTRAWVGFDDENVVVLREQSRGQQALAIYDFS